VLTPEIFQHVHDEILLDAQPRPAAQLPAAPPAVAVAARPAVTVEARAVFSCPLSTLSPTSTRSSKRSR
jgi:hypothetical protein